MEIIEGILPAGLKTLDAISDHEKRFAISFAIERKETKIKKIRIKTIIIRLKIFILSSFG
ncbi:MAG: hypothetical protein FJW61_05060 [Actinobacteria bacterium]|nr:hypothetical protein [Actinomycetota bacterium]